MFFKINFLIRFSASTLALLLAGCMALHRYSGESDGPPAYNVDVSKIPDAVPKNEPYSKYGNPPSYVVYGKRYYIMNSNKGYHERGIASWYGTKFHAKRTSSGEPYSMLTMTAAHKTLRIPAYAEVTNLTNGKHVIVKINDRGPFHENRIIDLSYAAAKKLEITGTGTGLVDVRVIDPSFPASDNTMLATNKDPKLYLQIGAFSQLANAQQLLHQIKPLANTNVTIKTAYKNDQPIYRVQIGPLASVDSTDLLHDKLKEAGLGNPVTVVQ